jgi:hypothetical protein
VPTSPSPASDGEHPLSIAPFNRHEFPFHADSSPLNQHRDIASIAPANALRHILN